MTWVRKITNFLLGSLLLLVQFNAAGQSYTGKDVKITLFSTTPVEDIRAVSMRGTAVLIAKTREIVVQVPIRTFEFDRRLMQEHFNENYMESDQYPLAKFKGTIDQGIDFAKAGTYDVTVNGTLSMHGVDKIRAITGKVSVENGEIRILTAFKVPCADHKIKIPTLIMAKVAEVISITLDGKLHQIK